MLNCDNSIQKSSKDSIKVSVCIVVYNQEKFIAQCLQSVADQITSFPFEVIISDDCSTDGTRRIINEFINRYPNKFKAVFHDINIGAYKNLVFVHQLAAGEYIAHLDGDDYWLPGKLQAQADFLDNNLECNVVFHRVRILYEGTGYIVDDLVDLNLIPDNGYTRDCILQHISVGSNSSKMYRRLRRVKMHPQFNIVDYFETVEQVGDGVARFVDDNFYGVYRANIGIASQGVGTRIALRDCFLFFFQKYPDSRSSINAAALLLLLADIKNRRSTVGVFFMVWIKTFHPMSVIKLIRNRAITRMLRLPSPKT